MESQSVFHAKTLAKICFLLNRAPDLVLCGAGRVEVGEEGLAAGTVRANLQGRHAAVRI